MASKKMLILRGNSAGAGKYPDEQGKKIAWPSGALHERAATYYAIYRGYEAVVLSVPGQPQNDKSPQLTTALKMFNDDPTVTAFYGFSGGGYNLWWILQHLASNTPDDLRRIDLIVVVGAPGTPESEYKADTYNAIVRKKVPKWKDVNWELVYMTNPTKEEMSVHLPDVPKDLESHMFGPDLLLAEAIGRLKPPRYHCAFYGDPPHQWVDY